jgi:hypothetical protein
MVFRRYTLTDPLVPAGILEGVANAIFSTEDILKAIGDLPQLELEEESDTDEESEGACAESDTENVSQ